MNGGVLHVRTLALLGMLSGTAFACGRDRVEEPLLPPVAPPPEIVAERAPEPPPPLYDDRGSLIASGERVAGLELPRGITLEREEERVHVYRSDVPTGKLIAFFARRLIAGEVRRVGDGVIYPNAVVQGAGHGSVTMDVSVLPTGTSARIEIRELRPPPRETPSAVEIERMMREQQTKAF